MTILAQVCTILFLLFCLSSKHCNNVEAKSNRRGPIQLDEDSWQQMMKGEWMVAFHAPWCPACRNLEPQWKKFSEWSDDLDINVASADITKNPGLNGRFMVKGLPTIYHVKDGVFRVYSGPRQHTSLVNFIEEQGWKAIEPQSRFWNPNTLQMTFVAYSFRMSMFLRDVHDWLVEKIGLPSYVSYSLFAIATVVFGTVLGFLIVFIIDQIYPKLTCNAQNTPNVALKNTTPQTKKKESDEDSEGVEVEPETGGGSGSEKVRRRTKVDS